MSWTPYPGQLVCCIDDEPTNAYGIIEIVRNNIYTVREIVEPDELWLYFLGGTDEVGVTLVEVIRERDPEYGEVPFRVSRFRPIDLERIEVFRRMLAPTDMVSA